MKFSHWYKETFNKDYSNRLNEVKQLHEKETAKEIAISREKYYVAAWNAHRKSCNLNKNVKIWLALSESAGKIRATETQSKSLLSAETSKNATDMWFDVKSDALKVAQMYDNILDALCENGKKSDITSLMIDANRVEKMYDKTLNKAKYTSRFADNNSKEAMEKACKLVQNKKKIARRNSFSEIHDSGKQDIESLITNATDKVECYVNKAVQDIQQLVQNATQLIPKINTETEHQNDEMCAATAETKCSSVDAETCLMQPPLSCYSKCPDRLDIGFVKDSLKDIYSNNEDSEECFVDMDENACMFGRIEKSSELFPGFCSECLTFSQYSPQPIDGGENEACCCCQNQDNSKAKVLELENRGPCGKLCFDASCSDQNCNVDDVISTFPGIGDNTNVIQMRGKDNFILSSVKKTSTVVRKGDTHKNKLLEEDTFTTISKADADGNIAGDTPATASQANDNEAANAGVQSKHKHDKKSNNSEGKGKDSAKRKRKNGNTGGMNEINTSEREYDSTGRPSSKILSDKKINKKKISKSGKKHNRRKISESEKSKVNQRSKSKNSESKTRKGRKSTLEKSSKKKQKSKNRPNRKSGTSGKNTPQGSKRKPKGNSKSVKKKTVKNSQPKKSGMSNNRTVINISKIKDSKKDLKPGRYKEKAQYWFQDELESSENSEDEIVYRISTEGETDTTDNYNSTFNSSDEDMVMKQNMRVNLKPRRRNFSDKDKHLTMNALPSNLSQFTINVPTVTVNTETINAIKDTSLKQLETSILDKVHAIEIESYKQCINWNSRKKGIASKKLIKIETKIQKIKTAATKTESKILELTKKMNNMSRFKKRKKAELLRIITDEQNKLMKIRDKIGKVENDKLRCEKIAIISEYKIKDTMSKLKIKSNM